MGIDFSIFAQAIESISSRGYPATSLIAQEWVNFLGHHFEPFLYLPGSLSFLGIKGTYLAIASHTLSVSLCLLALYFLAKELGYKKELRYLFLLIFMINPSIRHSLFWGLHDESFALAAVASSYLFWQRKSFYLSALSLVLAASIKESMFLYNLCFCVMVFWKNKGHSRQLLVYYFVFAISLLGFIGYFFLQPLIFNKSFDHFNKVSSFSNISATLPNKLIWIFLLFLPVAFYPLRNKKIWPYLLPATPFMAIVGVAQFSEMYKPFNYYTMLPTLIIYISCLYFFKTKQNFSNAFVLGAILLAFSFSGSKPSKELFQNLNQQLDSKELEAFKDQNIIVTRSSAPFLIDAKKIERLWIANKSTKVDFDTIITKHDEKHLIGEALLEVSRECHFLKDWYIRCKI